MSRRLFTRMAVRDARQNAWRSLLMVLMVALPVGAVAAMDIVIKTADVQPGESMSRVVGQASARISDEHGSVVQYGADWTRYLSAPSPEGRVDGSAAPDPAQVLGRAVERHELVLTDLVVRTSRGGVQTQVMAADWSARATRGLTRLTEGRVPSGPDEVAVNRALADRGPGLGTTARIEGRTARVVGIMEDATERAEPHAFVALGSDVIAPAVAGTSGYARSEWLITAEGGITWPDTVALNAAGYTVASPMVAAHPPSDAELLGDFSGWSQTLDRQVLAVLALVVVMVLLEVVLLAGPGFAVTARRRQRSLALLQVSGATPGQARRAVMATAWVMGLAAAAVGLVLGVVAAWLVLHVGQRWYGDWFPPLQWPLADLALVAVFGLLAALLAAWVPARTAARQDPVATLSGHRGGERLRLRNPIGGVALVAVGCALAWIGSRRGDDGVFLIALAALTSVLGMVLLVPMLLAWVGRLAARLPLTGRYAVRDAARHRGRTVPAIAAVGATVAAAVALSIGVSSLDRRDEATYVPSLPMGTSLLSSQNGTDIGRAVATVERLVPGARPEVVRGLGFRWSVELPGLEERPESYLATRTGQGLSAWVGTELPRFLDVPPAQRAAAADRLAHGGLVVFAPGAMALTEQQVKIHDLERDDARPVRFTAPVTVVTVSADQPVVQAMLAPELAERAGARTIAGTALFPAGAISPEQANLIDEQLALTDAHLTSERGYQQDPATRIIVWTLVATATLLMLGGTITSTLLSLSDARTDLATLASVGAAPSTRRSVAAGYALVIAGIGGLAGTVIGFIPGLAVAGPLTRTYDWDVQGLDLASSTTYLDVPWALIGLLLVALPLFSAALMAAFTRARLPLLERAG